MEELLKKELGVNSIELAGTTRGGVVNNSAVYKTEDGTKYFAKFNTNPETMAMFLGERESLQSIAATKAIRVPQIIKTVGHPSGHGAVSIIEHLDGLQRIKTPEMWTQLGDKIGRLHSHNIKLLKQKNKDATSITKSDDQPEPVEKFGYHCDTFLGRFTPGKGWSSTWMEHISREILKPIFAIIDWEFHDQEVRELWSELQLNLDKFFKDSEILPSLLHGDLCVVNVGHVVDEVVTYDAACLYGDPEFDLLQVCNDQFRSKFSDNFFEAYHEHIPLDKTSERRRRLYHLFSLAIYWIHGHSSLRDDTVKCMRELLEFVKTL